MSAVLAYITTPDRQQALRIGRALVEARLAACVNVLDGMHSIYRWEGRIEEADECILLAKTRSDLAEELVTMVKGLHSYACPCIVFWPLTGGHAAYLDWIEKETDPA